MKRILGITVLGLGVAMASCFSAHAAPKGDGRPDGGALNYSEYGRPATLDPITSNETISLRITELVFNGLVGIDEKQEIVPELAERWEASKDGRVYTFFLRKDVKWHPREGDAPALHGRRRGVHLQHHDAPQDHHAAQGALRVHREGREDRRLYGGDHPQAPDTERSGEVQLQDHPQARPGEPAVPDARGPVRPQPDRHRAVHAPDRNRRRRGGAARE